MKSPLLHKQGLDAFLQQLNDPSTTNPDDRTDEQYSHPFGSKGTEPEQVKHGFFDYDKLIPACVVYDPMQYGSPLSKSEAAFILQHEIDLFEEGEDGALSPEEIAPVRSALQKVRGSKQGAGLLSDILHPDRPAPEAPPRRNNTPGPVCETCGGGLTRYGDPAGESKMICTRCKYKKQAGMFHQYFLWGFKDGQVEVYDGTKDSLKGLSGMPHSRWFKELGWPTTGAMFDRIPRGDASAERDAAGKWFVHIGHYGELPEEVSEYFRQKFNGAEITDRQFSFADKYKAGAKKELVLYGLPKDATERYEEVLLLTNATPEKIERVKVLAAKDGFHSFRVAEIDLDTPPDFGKTVKGAKKPKCPHCGSSEYSLMPTDFETAKCKKCDKNWHHGIVPGINDPKAAAAKKASAELYHVTFTRKVPKIKREGIRPLQTSNWVKGQKGERYGEGEIFAFEQPADAVRWAAKMDWDFHQEMGTGKISIVRFDPGDAKWIEDTADPMSRAMAKGKWLKLVGSVPANQILGAKPLTPDLVQMVIKGEDVHLAAARKLVRRLGMLRPSFVQAVQKLYNQWKGGDEEGLCGDIANVFRDTIAKAYPDLKFGYIDVVYPDMSHTVLAVTDTQEAVEVDIPWTRYEKPSDQSGLVKIKGVKFTPKDIVIQATDPSGANWDDDEIQKKFVHLSRKKFHDDSGATTGLRNRPDYGESDSYTSKMNELNKSALFENEPDFSHQPYNHPCSKCDGKGCPHCGGTGQSVLPYQKSGMANPLLRRKAAQQPRSPEEVGPEHPFICEKCGQPIVAGKEGFINKGGFPQHVACAAPGEVEEYKNANNGWGWFLDPDAFPAWHPLSEEMRKICPCAKCKGMKQAEVGIKESPRHLPPRDDMRRHLDEDVQKEVESGTKVPREGIKVGGEWELREENFVEQTHDALEEARDAFMQDRFMREEAQASGLSMDQLWTEYGQDYANEYHAVRTSSKVAIKAEEGCVMCPKCSNDKAKEILDEEAYGSIRLYECPGCSYLFSL